MGMKINEAFAVLLIVVAMESLIAGAFPGQQCILDDRCEIDEYCDLTGMFFEGSFLNIRPLTKFWC